jgi:hypothetical protein
MPRAAWFALVGILIVLTCAAIVYLNVRRDAPPQGRFQTIAVDGVGGYHPNPNGSAECVKERAETLAIARRRVVLAP